MKIHLEQIKTTEKCHGKKIKFHKFRIRENMWWTRYRPLAQPFMKTPWHGAQTTLYCLLDNKIGNFDIFIFVFCPWHLIRSFWSWRLKFQYLTIRVFYILPYFFFLNCVLMCMVSIQERFVIKICHLDTFYFLLYISIPYF